MKKFIKTFLNYLIILSFVSWKFKSDILKTFLVFLAGVIILIFYFSLFFYIEKNKLHRKNIIEFLFYRIDLFLVIYLNIVLISVFYLISNKFPSFVTVCLSIIIISTLTFLFRKIKFFKK